MAEYLSPGVYVEEFDSGSKPMEGVGTSTAGFIGLAERGPVEGLPQLIFPILRESTAVIYRKMSMANTASWLMPWSTSLSTVVPVAIFHV